MKRAYVLIPNEGIREYKEVVLAPGETVEQASKRAEEEALCWIWYNGNNGQAVVAESKSEAKRILTLRGAKREREQLP